MENHGKSFKLFVRFKTFFTLTYHFSTDTQKGMVNRMIDKENFHHFNYIKKEELSGSMEGMRYMMKKIKVGEEDKLQVTIWPGPLNYFKTPEEKKTMIELPFSPEGVERAADWLNEQYEADKTTWEKGKRLI